MELEKVTKFLKKEVAIGIPHYDNPDKLFFNFGTITEANEEYIILEFPTGIKQIPLDQIKEIHIARNEERREWS